MMFTANCSTPWVVTNTVENGDTTPICIAMTGASGAPYGLRLLEYLLQTEHRVYLLISRAARVVIATETRLQLPGTPAETATWLGRHFSINPDQLQVFGLEQWTAPVASGSSPPTAMVVCPCSMSMVSAIACGASNNLIERAADVMLKEQRKLILVPRESPFSAIHLENMLKLARLGVTILPANPGFYHQPQTVEAVIEHVVARILDHLQINHDLVPRWGYGHNNQA